VQLAKVIGQVVCTRKDDNLSSLTLLVLQPIAPDGAATGRTLVAVDAMGAGVGETRGSGGASPTRRACCVN
jgi:microcompartment protein CcmK/EutM